MATLLGFITRRRTAAPSKPVGNPDLKKLDRDWDLVVKAEFLMKYGRTIGALKFVMGVDEDSEDDSFETIVSSQPEEFKEAVIGWLMMLYMAIKQCRMNFYPDLYSGFLFVLEQNFDLLLKAASNEGILPKAVDNNYDFGRWMKKTGKELELQANLRI